MNETRNIIVGLDIGRSHSQICYFDRKEREPVSVSVKAGSNLYEFATLLSKTPGKEVWHCGLEAEFHTAHEGDLPVYGILGICGAESPVQIDGREYLPEELMAHYLEGCIGLLGVGDPVRQIKAIMVTVPLLNAPLVRALQKAGERLGFSRKQLYLQDYAESFYYYAMNHRRENWNRRAGWFIFDGNQVSFAKLEIDASRRPMLAAVRFGESAMLPEDPQERDDAFHQLIADSCRSDAYTSIYMVGPGFDQSWAVRSIPYLCRNQRRVYYGNNLYVKGACFGAREKCGEDELKGLQYLSPMMIKSNVNMEMDVGGSLRNVPIVEAGRLWYEVYTSLELILDEKEELEFTVIPMEGGSRAKFVMKLPGLPKRPNKTTRLLLTVTYESEEQCLIRAEDLGFGELFPSDGKVWTEKVSW